jgi:hypothetical protein
MANVVLHNMILEDESLKELKPFKPHRNIHTRHGLSFVDLKQSTKHIKNSELHYQLKNELIEHL